MTRTAPKTPAGTPIFTRLRRARRVDDYLALLAYAETPTAANDNDPDHDGATDSVMIVYPTPEELLVAGEDGVRFRGGKISSYRTAKGKWLPAREKYRQPRGEASSLTAKKAEDAKYAERHLSLVATEPFLPPFERRANYPSACEMNRRAGSADRITSANRYILQWFGVDGSVPFDTARKNAWPPPADRGAVSVASGAEFMAGRIASTGLAMSGLSQDGRAILAPAEFDKATVDETIGAEVTNILELMLARLTAREMAVELGWGNSKSAEQRAVRTQDRALQSLRKFAA